MRVNIEWLRDWVSIDLEPAELAERLTVAGLEVDSVEAAAPDFEGPVVAEITAVQPHPDADRLVVCEVDDGGEQHVVVCGAPNATRGLKAPFAPIGTRLPGGLKIGRAKLRGVTSEGMLCSEKDLGLAEESEGLMELPEDATVASATSEVLRLYPRVTGDASKLMVAVNEEYQEHDFRLSDGDEVALIPPVSGGCFFR